MAGTATNPKAISPLKAAISDREKFSIYLFTFAFFLTTILKIAHHEMWFDETESWLIARDSNSLGELLVNKQFESHPNLWYFILYGITRFSHNVYLMQVLHVVLATGAVFLFLRYATFPFFTRVLFCLGYFIFYEYSVITRLYALGLLLLFGACALYPYRYKYWLWFCLLLCLAAQANLFAAMIAGGIVLICFFEYLKPTENKLLINSFKLWSGLLLLFSGFLYSMLSMVKHPNHSVQFSPEFSGKILVKKIGYFFNAFFPVAPFRITFWQTNIVESSHVKVLCSLLVLGFIFYYFRRRKHFFFTYCCILLAMMAFFFLLYNGSLRHHGHMFMLFAVLAWLYNSELQRKNAAFTDRQYKDKTATWLLNLLLFIHVFGGLQATAYDLKYKFSANEDLAAYLDTHFEAGTFITGTSEIATSPLAAYSKKFKKLYYYDTMRYGSFFADEKKARRRDPLDAIIKNCQGIAGKRRQDVLLVTVGRYESEATIRKIKQMPGVQELYTSPRELILDFPLTLYRISYQDPPQPQTSTESRQQQ
ncbi:hypothetical protein [Adhaeribacter soli]|uniref:Glycosyltransferase RgtA/B/C/D-like domain-containing protein n=1 Tax=Adhaeribacter soli TaxID=2607655 RepID=A0A5N1IMB2_9BACT|nr:hypothetical protein [Adhaeribacter soli]KAA9324941.1 hypothetical protein F0P94_19410 [Adhaeribacter soli]